jgi:hypothetical protein
LVRSLNSLDTRKPQFLYQPVPVRSAVPFRPPFRPGFSFSVFLGWDGDVNGWRGWVTVSRNGFRPGFPQARPKRLFGLVIPASRSASAGSRAKTKAFFLSQYSA